MTKLTMEDYGLHPDSNLEDEENQTRFFEYHIALVMEIVDRYRLTKEMIPIRTVRERLCSEFGISDDRHFEIMSKVSNSIEDDEDEVLSEEDEELARDLANFIEKRLEEEQKQDELFKFLSDDF